MADATAPAASEAAAEKKELTREQLLLYIKKLKVRPPLCSSCGSGKIIARMRRLKSHHHPSIHPSIQLFTQVRVKELEGQVESAKQQQAGALRQGDEAMQARLVEAAEQIHAAQRDGKAKVRAQEPRSIAGGRNTFMYVSSQSNPINTSLQPNPKSSANVIRSTP